MPTTKVIMSSPWTAKSVNKNEYVCSLSNDAIKVAANELREDNNTREQALEQFRDWVIKNPEIVNCRTDNDFLLRFLRVKKFSVPLAEHTLMKYLNLRQTLSHLFYNLDCLSGKVGELIDNGYLYVSPIRDAKGRRVLIHMASKLDPQRFTNVHMSKVHVITYETLLEDEENQVMGFTHFGDVKGAAIGLLTLWNPNEFATTIRIGEQAMPMRNKEIHVLNVPAPFKYVYDFARTRFSRKIRQRFMIHDTLEEVQQHIDSKCLPKEYGGVIPEAEMIAMWKKELTAKRDKLLALDRMKISVNNKTSNNNDVHTVSSISSLPGSFRRLEVD